MDLLDLVHTLTVRGILPTSRAKDMKTSVQKLADAYQLPVERLDLVQIASTYQDVLTAYFASLVPVPSRYTIRNTKQNLAQLFRGAQTLGLLTVAMPTRPTRLNTRQANIEASQRTPYMLRSYPYLSKYVIPKSDWPAAVRQPWDEYCASRDGVRESTLILYERQLSTYVSYSLGVEQPGITQWRQLFEVARLRRFVRWHAARVNASDGGQSRITATGFQAVKILVMLAKHLRFRREYRDLSAYYQQLPTVEPWHHKDSPIHTFTPQELEEVGLWLRAASQEPMLRVREKYVKHIGLHRAIQNQTGLLIRLWWRVPIRSRSMRELDIKLPAAGARVSRRQPRLYQDEQQVWQLRFQGEQLKVGQRRGKINEFAVPFPPELVDHLEEYLTRFRPLLPKADTTPNLFLNRWGDAFSSQAIWRKLSTNVYKHTRKRIYPHLLRTLWVDTYLLESGGDIDTAAFMLNDSPQTVLKHYHELRAERQVPKAYDFNRRILEQPRNGIAH